MTNIFFYAALIILAAFGIFYLLKLAVWFWVSRPIEKAFDTKTIIESLGDTWGEPDDKKLWWFMGLYP